MSERNFSHRRRGGMRFRPSGGPPHNMRRPDRAANEARAQAIGEKASNEGVFDSARHQREIERAENIAAGLPPDSKPEPAPTPNLPERKKSDYREPHLETPAEVKEESGFRPVPVTEPPPKGIVQTLRAAASNVIKRVQRLIKPVKRIHKEVIINAESHETRDAVLEECKLEEFTIERASDERMVGSIYKGKV
ncbi:MAG: ribonuclease E/G, partial [Verrucomicrobia bacterium]|nr:ribonuclease E/G [Verrucomicrobiota bacterium]